MSDHPLLSPNRYYNLKVPPVAIEAAAEIAALREKLRLAEEATQWRPIESAPREGSVLLLLGESIPDMPDIRVGGFISGKDCIELGEYACEETGGWLVWNTESDWFVAEIDDPTHWMPLPNPPASIAVQKDGKEI